MKTLIFFLDAVREDYITQKHTPFIYNFKNKETYMDLISLLGYSAGIHPSIWSGQYQEELGTFLIYSYNEKQDRLGWAKALKYFPSKIRQYIIGSLKVPYYMFPITKKIYPTWYKKKILPMPASIDPDMAKFFKIEDTTFKNKFFEILENKKITYTSQPEFNNPNYGSGNGLDGWTLTEKNVDYYFAWDSDALGHYPGPNSDRLLNKLSLYDSKIKEIYEEAKNKYSKVNLFIFSDHGMEEVIGNINVKEILEKTELKPIKDYVVFYDSTMVRFWTSNENVKKRILEIMSKTKNITYLNETLRKKHHINFKTRKWGDLLFLANNGYRIFPDYFSPVRFNTKGLHGYFPEKTKNAKGVFMTNAFKTKNKEIRIVDIFPTLLKTMKLKKDIPKSCKGKSVF